MSIGDKANLATDTSQADESSKMPPGQAYSKVVPSQPPYQVLLSKRDH
jgi:hypothetical protein